jgi:myo-inositol catabolism protein IolC
MPDRLRVILDARTRRPQAIAEAADQRKRRAALLGGEVSADQNAAFDRWHKALQMPTVHGLVVGRTLLFPPDDDVTGAVDAAVSLMRG